MNPRQQRFVEEYLIDLNATRAYRVAYPKVKSDETAAANGARLLANANVAKAIKAAIAARSQKTQITAERVLRELARLAFSDHRKLYHPDGRLKSPHELDDDTAATIASSEVEEERSGDTTVTRTRKIKQWDKREALNLLGKHLGLFTERVHVTGQVQTSAPAMKLNLTVLSDDQLRTMAGLLTAATADSQPADAGGRPANSPGVEPTEPV